MKKILIPVIAIASMTALSFKPVSNKIVRLDNGNYYIPKGVVSPEDAQALYKLTYSGESSVNVASAKLFKEILNTAVTKTTDGVETTKTTKTAATKGTETKPQMSEYALVQKVESILSKYE